MFVHQNQLAYQLAPETYFSPEHYELEVERLFLPTWHFVGSKADLPKSGDFRTLELFGRPLLIRNFDGEFHAFLNVCSHRHCLLTHQPRGHSDKFRCQYHGWEYDAAGRTRKIPDAGCFRPFDREHARLQKFRLESCGELLFVSLAEDGPELCEYLGDFYDVIAERFVEPWRQALSWEHDYPSNWKLPVENTVESYHLPCLHTGIFAAVYPSEAAQQHELRDRHNTLTHDITENASLTFWQGWAAGVLGASRANTYVHRLTYPHFVVTVSDLMVHAQLYFPTSPTTSRTILRAYSYWGQRRSPLAWWMARATAYQVRTGNLKVQLEDAAIFADAQRGIEASVHQGCIGTREERVYAFQEFVRQRCGLPPVDVAPHDPAAHGARACRDCSSIRAASSQ
jgi:phenylpropionate dioxygenase-like ring-hydroxylating dioxygenase large terminal subunit